MVDNSSGEDTRKKRDNAQVHAEEKPKKIQKAESLEDKEDNKDDNDHKDAAILPSPPKRRATEQATTFTASSSGYVETSTTVPGEGNQYFSFTPKGRPCTGALKRLSTTSAKRTKRQNNNSTTAPVKEREIWDLESAMLYLVRLNKLGDVGTGVGDITNDSATPPSTAAAEAVGWLLPTKSSNESSSSSVAAVASAAATTSADSLEPRPHPQSQQPRSSPQPSEQDREYLTPDKSTWITFGMAHSGDAATIANWYRKCEEEKASEVAKQQAQPEDGPEIDIKEAAAAAADQDDGDQNPSSQQNQLPLLEHWLAEGLGDEVTCPSVYGLLAYVHSSDSDGDKKMGKDEKDRKGNNKETSNNKDEEDDQDKKPPAINTKGNKNDNHSTQKPPPSQSRMAAVVLLTLAWTSNERHLRVEWMAIDSKQLSTPIVQEVQQKVWLRISALSVMTACPVIAVDETLLLEVSGTSETDMGGVDEKEKSTKKKWIEPSAE